MTTPQLEPGNEIWNRVQITICRNYDRVLRSVVFVRLLVRSLTSGNPLHWLTGGGQAGDQHRSGVTAAWRRWRHTSAFSRF